MRLINSKTLKLEEPGGGNFPTLRNTLTYLGMDEASFHDIQSRNCKEKLGCQKIAHCWAIATEDGFEYA
jgi:hypothetical protein